MSRKKTSAELRAEINFIKKHGIGNNITKIARDLIKYVCLFGCCYFAYLSIDSLSGKDTSADITVKAEGNFSLNNKKNTEKRIEKTTDIKAATVTLALLFGLGGILYGRKQAKLRKDLIERYHPIMQEAERAKDVNRSTSKLTMRGDTRPEDQ